MIYLKCCHQTRKRIWEVVYHMLSQTLKRLRENCGYTQQQVADALNIDRSTYTYYETAKTTPDINTIIKLAKIFNVTYSDILDDDAGPTARVSDSGKGSSSEKRHSKNSSLIYELTKNEKQLIIYYRLMDKASQKEFLDTAYLKIKNSK